MLHYLYVIYMIYKSESPSILKKEVKNKYFSLFIIYIILFLYHAIFFTQLKYFLGFMK